jgi:hypothetical protein
MWYLFMKAMEEKETQKHGIVCLYYQSGFVIGEKFHLEFYYKSSIIQKGLPLMIRGFHFCYDSEIFRPIMSAMQLAIGNQNRLRFRSHYGTSCFVCPSFRIYCLSSFGSPLFVVLGSPMEVQYSIQSFGISDGLVPIGKNGELSFEHFQNFLATEIERERSEEARQGGKIFCPTSLDVLLGRGRHPQEHEGNRNLAKIVENHAKVYRTTRKHDKRGVHILVVKTIQAQGGRFLKRADTLGEGWVEVDDHTAIDKVRNRFRKASTDEF